MIERESALENLANYNNMNAIKYLLMNIHNLKKEAEKGNTTAHCIYLDFRKAMKSDLLTKKQQEVIYQKYIIGHTNTKIAEITGVTENAVRKHLAGGLKRIRKILCEGDKP